ncbi:MAG: hypothetical protein GY918_14870 [Gammaproteobacteria bacterium]|nr:hypothetical protein [Gammaproteobacteria bacterium]
MKAVITTAFEALLPFVPAFIGGLIDYFNQLHKGTKAWSIFGFLMHLSSAFFFGWLCGLTAAGAGYTEDVVYAAGGMGGFLGVRVIDLVTHLIRRGS